MPDASGYVNGQGKCAIQIQDYSEAIVVSMVILEFQATETLALRKELGSWSDVTGSARCWNGDMGKCAIQIQDYSEAIVVSMVILEFQATETLALRKELGSWSDVTGSARCWNMDMGKCAIQIQDYSEAIVVSMVILEFQATETLALRKELGSWSDVTGSARCWNGDMGECAIQFQDYSEAIVVSMVILEFQATGPR
ncbi:Wd Repeat-Containing Protein 86 [Manis pentadactyla]|nr:Wd Repeat-Containing Protein 86 [Manis pentadactyla]